MNEEEKKWRRKLANEKRKEYRRGLNDGVKEGKELLAEALRELIGAVGVGHEHEEYSREW